MRPIKKLAAILALGTILLTAALVSFTKLAGPDKESDLALIAVSEDAPEVLCNVKVLNPDGTPADRASIHAVTLAVKENVPTCPGCKASYYPSTGDFSGGTDKEGNYSFEAAPKVSVLIYSYRTTPSKTLVSQPAVFTVNEGGNDITIQLQEGTLVYGTAKFEDGSPAKDRTIMGFRPIDPPLVEINNMNIDNAFKSNFILEFQTRVQADGQYELYLPPGNFSIKEYDDREGQRAVPVSIERIKDGGTKEDHHIDFLSVPAPLRGKFVKEDGETVVIAH